ncbi:uncharacterized protein LOC132612157 [Lycium barbarum]|uniref:uncharacterized protein LOC132612157 n=1 Tax=Lycium barbarum TaxID=112863 RepID=UPI00293F2D15|nr:uncharacterized protein LOC132612157 [Lycium barbarum]
MIPLWVKLPNLPLSCWGPKSLSRIANTLGTPICVDDCTSKLERVSYARLLIEMDATVALPNVIKVIDPHGEVFDQEVWCDWKLQYCPICCQISHLCQPPPPKKVAEKQPEPVAQRKGHDKQPQVWQSKEKGEGNLAVKNTDSAEAGSGVEEGEWKKASGKVKVPAPVRDEPATFNGFNLLVQDVLQQMIHASFNGAEVG